MQKKKCLYTCLPHLHAPFYWMLPIEKTGIVEKVRKSDFGMQSQLISAWITLLLSNAECLKVRDFGWVKLAKVFYQILFFFWPIHLFLEPKWHAGKLLIVMTWLASLLVKGLESFMNTQTSFNQGAFHKVILVSISLSLKKWGTSNHSFSCFRKHFRFCNEC